MSIMSNLAEGFERGGHSEFHQYLVIAKASYSEVRSQLYLALDVGYVQKNEFHRIMQMAEEVSRLIGGLCSAVHRKKKSG